MDDIMRISLDGARYVHTSSKSILFEQRVILGLTQQAVADRAHIPLQSYQAFESGKRDIFNASFRIACKVLEALEMNIVDFYHGKYFIGEEVFDSKEGLRYKKSGRLVDEDVTE